MPTTLRASHDRTGRSTALPAREALDPVVRVAASLLGVAGAVVTFLDGSTLRFLAAAGPAFADGAPDSAPAADTPCALVVVVGLPVFLTDAPADPIVGPLGLTRALGIRGLASAPIRLATNDCIGTVTIFDRVPRDWSPEERQAVQDLAAIASTEFGRAEAVATLERDVEHRRASEALLRESDTLHRVALELSREALWVEDYATRTIRRGDGYTTLFGYAPGAIGTSETWWIDRVHPDDRGRVIEDYRRTESSTETHWQFEYRFQRADGSWAEVVDHGQVIRDPEGRPVRLIGALQDVSALAASARELARTQDRYRGLVHTINGIVWEADPSDGRFSFVSPQAHRMLGHPVDAWLEPGFWSRAIHPEDREAVLARRRVEALAGRDHELDYRLLASDGRVVWVRDFTSVAPASGQPPRLHGVMVDITEQKRTEEALRQREEQLRQALKMEAVGRLAGGIAHDFNNLLTAIVGYSDLLAAEMPDAARQGELAEIRRAAERAASLTSQLLAFSRKQVQQLTDLDLDQVVVELGSLLARLIGEHIRLETRPAGRPVWLRADRSQLEQVIINLAVNARDAMPQGGVLTLSTGLTGPDEALPPELVEVGAGPYARLTIRDTGVGMDQATLDHIFEPFFTTKDVGQGTGLGLATVYGVVRQSGGGVRVESTPGVGTAFHIYLPVGRPPAGRPGTPAAREALYGGTETILLVEDEDAVRRLAGSVLRKLGYTVLEAPSGPAALSLVRHHPDAVALVLSDVVMPGLSGPETVAALANFLPRARVLFMSGYPAPETNGPGGPLRGHDLLSKPFTPEVLARRVREVLDRPRPA